jgi:hypothetical protein
MKTLVISAALATLLTSPAFAQAYGPFGSGNIVFPPGASNDGSPLVAPNATNSAGSYAYETRPVPKPEHTANARRLRVLHHVKHVRRADAQD